MPYENHHNYRKSHTPYRWFHSNAAERQSETDFRTTGEHSSKNKLAIQMDTGDVYELVEEFPITWELRILSAASIMQLIEDAVSEGGGGGGAGST